MRNSKTNKSLAVPYVNRWQLVDGVNIHAGRQPCVMHLHAVNAVLDEQRAPALMGFAAVRQKLEIPLDHARKAVSFGDG